ncbi:MAG: ATP-binding protein, partial [Oscillospiraceae bacterium]
EMPPLGELLELANQRLLTVEETPGVGGIALCLRRERRYCAKCQALMREGGVAPLEYLLHRFGLTEFERHCVTLALAVELDSSYETRFAQLQGGCRLPTLDICLRTFSEDVEERAELLGQWRSHRGDLAFFFRNLSQQTEAQGDLTVGLKLEGRIVDFVLDFAGDNTELAGKIQLYFPGEAASGELSPLILYGDCLSPMTAVAASAPTLFYLKGESGAGRRTLARHFCQAMERPLLVADIAALLQEPHWETAVLSVCREALIRNAFLAFSSFELLQEPEDAPPVREDEEPMARANRTDSYRLYLAILLRRAARVSSMLFLLSPRPWKAGESCAPYQRMELALDMPDTGGRILLWNHALEGVALAEDIHLPALAAKFALNPGQISAAAAEARRQMSWEGALTDDLLHRACRAQLSHGLGKKASKVNAAYTWEDLILPPEAKQQLKNACNQVEYRHQVYDNWGFGKKVAYGRGLSILFTGPPGTGKTMAAQVLASQLHLELYKVDLSGVMSKYIGETEKQLGAVFDEVKKSQSILFFDEADALFGKRSETKDANDRYANVQTSYLLQKMEEYDGTVILASNFLQNFDEAFRRRIKFIVEFPLPDRERREQIWRSVMPRELPMEEDIDFDFLARSFELSGSSIKNIVVSAAFLAAAEAVPMGMVQLLLATQSEQHKTGKNIGREEFGEYFHQVQSYLN